MSDLANEAYVKLLKEEMPESIKFGEESLKLSSVDLYGPNEIEVVYTGSDIDSDNRAIPDEIMSEIEIGGRLYHRSASGVTPEKRMYIYSPQNIDHDDTKEPEE